MARIQSFAERMGVESAPALGLQEICEPLRVAVWNYCHGWLFPTGSGQWKRYQNLMHVLYEHLGTPTTSIPHGAFDGRDAIYKWLITATWTGFYGFVELLPFLYGMIQDYRRDERLEEARLTINEVLEQHGSPYRMATNQQLIPLTSEQELAEVRNAATTSGRFQLAAKHISDALAHIARRPEPDYKDSIKQSFCAVESAVWIAIGEKPRFAVALKKFEEMHALHGSLTQMIDKLHGYASDEEGVRHGATETSPVGEAEARMMLVTCSAIVNYIVRKAEKS
jgi:hypothetical protein